MSRLTRLLPLALLLAAALALWLSGALDLLSLEGLRQNRVALTEAVAERPVVAALLYVAAYAAVVALSLPVGLAFTLAGGFLFGWILGGALAVTAASLGAIGLYLAARYAARDALAERAGPWVARLAGWLRSNGFQAVLTLRLLPVMPFWLTNLVSALAGVPFPAYALGTLLGILPGTFIFASIGSGLGHVLDQPGEISTADLVTAETLLPLFLLALLSLLPRLFRGRIAALKQGGSDA